MSYNERGSEALPVVGAIPAFSGIASYYSDAISLDSLRGRRLYMVINTGALGSSGTVDANLQWSTTAQGSYTVYTPSAITQIVQGTTAGPCVVTTEVSVEQVVAANPTAKYMKGYIRTLVAATAASVSILGLEPAVKPVSTSYMTSYFTAAYPAAGTIA